MDTEKVGKWIKICGLTFTGICLVILVVFSFSNCSKKPLGPGEDKHWIDPSPSNP